MIDILLLVVSQAQHFKSPGDVCGAAVRPVSVRVCICCLSGRQRFGRVLVGLLWWRFGVYFGGACFGWCLGLCFGWSFGAGGWCFGGAGGGVLVVLVVVFWVVLWWCFGWVGGVVVVAHKQPNDPGA